ncbi:MAG: hypothetical protein ACEPOW_09145 [Bacteroidales bacterium]
MEVNKIIIRSEFDLDDVLALCVLSKVKKMNFVFPNTDGTVVSAQAVEIVKGLPADEDLHNDKAIVLQHQIETDVLKNNFGAKQSSLAYSVLSEFANDSIAGGVLVLLNEIQAFNNGEKQCKNHPASLFTVIKSMNNLAFPDGINKAVELMSDLFEASLACIPSEKEQE